MSQPEGYRFHTPVPVRFGDVDVMGHVNNAMYFTYMEQGRVLYFDDVMKLVREKGAMSAILAAASIQYKAPLYYRDVIDVWTRVSKLGNKSFEQEYTLIRQSDGLLVATGSTVTVAYDYGAERTIPLPEEWRANIVAYEPALDG